MSITIVAREHTHTQIHTQVATGNPVPVVQLTNSRVEQPNGHTARKTAEWCISMQCGANSSQHDAL